VSAYVFRRLAFNGLRFAIDTHLAKKVASPSMIDPESECALATLEKATL
jgi:hypothetical protein